MDPCVLSQALFNTNGLDYLQRITGPKKTCYGAWWGQKKVFRTNYQKFDFSSVQKHHVCVLGHDIHFPTHHTFPKIEKKKWTFLKISLSWKNFENFAKSFSPCSSQSKNRFLCRSRKAIVKKQMNIKVMTMAGKITDLPQKKHLFFFFVQTTSLSTHFFVCFFFKKKKLDFDHI